VFLDSSSDPIGAAFASVLGLLGLLVLVGLYFLPSVIAFARHQQEGMVFVLNFFLGWTLVGWVVALAISAGRSPSLWSCSKASPSRHHRSQRDRKSRPMAGTGGTVGSGN
jgi:hypothetical protein